MRAALLFIAMGWALPPVRAELPVLYASRPGAVVKLADLNGDGDFLDGGESLTFAAGLTGTLGAIALSGADLLVVSNQSGSPGSIYALRDLNGDGDALDFGEVMIFAQLSGATLVGLACMEGACYTVDSISGQLYRFADLNGDGDALDAGESVVVASGLTGAVSVCAMQGGLLLVATSSTSVPVRILQDRDGDGTFLSFAENISYAENFTAGNDLACAGNATSFLARSVDGRVLRLHDRTGDGDVLDFGEVADFAVGLTSASRIAFANGDVFVASADPQGNLWRLHDANADDDALDFGEISLVATGLTQVGGLTAESGLALCLAGDVDGDGTVSVNDIPGFANALIGAGPPVELCRLDTNLDGLADGRDVRGLVRLLVP